MSKDLARQVGSRAAKWLSTFPVRARAGSPLPVLEVLLFEPHARSDAVRGSCWDVAVVVHAGDSEALRDVRRTALNVFADIALPNIVAGFHLRPIVIPATAGNADR